MKSYKALARLFLAIAILLSLASFAAAELNDAPTTTITLSETELVVLKGKPATLKATIQSDAKGLKLEWESTDENIATVKNGRIEGKLNGECDIICRAADDSGISAACHVEVKTGVKKLSITDKKVKLLVGSSDEAAMIQLTCVIAPEDASWQDVNWSSSNESVATVSSDGIVRGISKGQATIVASSIQPKSTLKAQIQVSVEQAVERIDFDTDSISVQYGKTASLKADVKPSNASNKKVTWTSSDESIALVSANGQIKGKGVGTAIITAMAADGSGVSKECQVNVAKLIQGIQLNEKELEIPVGESISVGYTIKPEDATKKEIQWKSTDESVCTVDGSGLVTAIGKGKCDIICSATDGSEKASKIAVTAFVPNPPILFRNIPWGANLQESKEVGEWTEEEQQFWFDNPSEDKYLDTIDLLNWYYGPNRGSVSTGYQVHIFKVGNVAGYTPSFAELQYAFGIKDNMVSKSPEDSQLIMGQYKFDFPDKDSMKKASIDIEEKLTSIYGKPARKGKPDKKGNNNYGLTHVTWEDDYKNRIVLSTNNYSSYFLVNYVWYKADDLLKEVNQIQVDRMESPEGKINGL